MATKSVGGKTDRPLTVVKKSFQPMNVSGGMGMFGYKSRYRAPTAQTSKGYTSGARTSFYGGAARRPSVPSMPKPTGVETVVRPGVPSNRVVSNVVRERTTRVKPVGSSAPAARQKTAAQKAYAARQQERFGVLTSSGRSAGRIGTRTGGVARGTGGRMTKAQRDAPAGPRGGGGGGRIGTRTGGVGRGGGGRQTQSQRNAPAGPRGSRM